ncbi:MAG TPA: hypothetical protein VGO00_02405, partial [Kofleriaceae bacterium]|nr:hypothetical protein [Kofleriaceae bacterium]
IDHGASGVFRAGFGGRHVYGLAELEIGGLTAAPGFETRTTESSLPTTTLGYAAVVGIAEPLSGHSRIGLEGAFGGRTLIYAVDQTQAFAATVPVVEARVRAETWLSPWMTAGVTLGSSVIERNDWMAGAYIGFHTRAYGGQR